MRLIPLLSILWFLYSCNDSKEPANNLQSNQYIYYEKWKIDNNYPESWLKNKPMSVIVRSYAITDSSFREPRGQIHDEDIYHFNKSGDCVYQRTNSFEDTTEAFSWYTDSGFQFREYQLRGNGREKISVRIEKSVPVNNRSYRTLIYEKNELTDSTVTSFKTGGKVIITWPSLSQETDSEQRWYVKGRLVKIVNTEEGISDTIFYNRKESGQLESIKSKEGIDIFKNNEHGDPVIHFKCVDNKLYSETRLRYVYDEQGNWIKRFWITEPRNDFGFKVGQLQVREISY